MPFKNKCEYSLVLAQDPVACNNGFWPDRNLISNSFKVRRGLYFLNSNADLAGDSFFFKWKLMQSRNLSTACTEADPERRNLITEIIFLH